VTKAAVVLKLGFILFSLLFGEMDYVVLFKVNLLSKFF